MKKVLEVMTDGIHHDGITNVVMNYLSHMDRRDIEIHIIASRISDLNLREKMEALGIRVILAPNRKKKLFLYLRMMNHFLMKEKYNVIHVHGNSASMTFELLLAKIQSIPIRIAHCHSSECEHKLLHYALKPFFKSTYTVALACSEQAGSWIFTGSDFQVLRNAIEVESFMFNNEKREVYRKKLGLNEKLVVGHVGKMNYIKNQAFLVDILPMLREKGDVHLLLVSGGGDKGKIMEQIKERGLESHITILESRTDVNEILNAMDVFAFPSLYEGLGMALIEAQASGLVCVASKHVPACTSITGRVKYLSILDRGAWIDAIGNAFFLCMPRRGDDLYEKIRGAGYDIFIEAPRLREIYCGKI